MQRKITLILLALFISTFVNAQVRDLKAGRGPKNASIVSNSLIPNLEKRKTTMLNAANAVKYKGNGLSRLDNIDKDKRMPGVAGLNQKSISALDSVLFMRPQGYFWAGMTTDYSSYYYYFLLGPAYSSSNWRNYSGGATSYLWTLPDPNGTIDENGDILATITSTEENPEAYYPFASFFSTPSLTASDGTNSLTYSLGGVDSTYVFAGGSFDDYVGTGACNYDCHKNMYAYYFEEGDYLFGSGPDGSNDAVANYFEKPSHEYVLDSLWINATYCTLPAGTELQLIIHKLDEEGNLSDTIASATAKANNILGPFGSDNTYYTIVFSEFSVFDADLGFEVTQDYIEISDAILIELKGFNVEGAEFSVMAQEFDTSPVNENNAFVFYYEDGVRDWGSYEGSTTLAFNLGIIYTYLFADDTTYIASAGGDSKVFNIMSMYSPEDIWFENELPEWLSYDFTFDEDTWDITLTFNAEALPSGVKGRGTTALLKTYGASFPISITQGDYNSIDGRELMRTRAFADNGAINLTYAKEYNNVSVYSASGQIIGRYSLPSSGSFSFIPTVKQKGLYLLKLNGENNRTETVKVVL
jgi:hypothetical protein